MGITGLLPLMKGATKDVKLEKLRGTVAAVDTSGWIHRACYHCGDKIYLSEPTDMYIKYCLNYVQLLRSYDITPILVFDGQSLPAKAETKLKRQKRKEEVRAKIEELRRQGDERGARWLMRTCVDVTFDMVAKVIEGCRAEGIDYMMAPFEADSQITYLVNTGIADYAISEDSDLLVFGCRRVLYKLDRETAKGQMVELDRLNRCFKNFDDKKFQYMCILSGCDYLSNLPSVAIGRAKKYFEFPSTTISNSEKSGLSSLLKAIPKALNLPKVKVPDEYIEGFIRARNAFDYQLIFCPFKDDVTHLKPLKGGLDTHRAWKLGTYAGEFFSEKCLKHSNFVLHYIMGNVDPKTLEIVDPEFDPCSNRINGRWFSEVISERVRKRGGFRVKLECSENGVKRGVSEDENDGEEEVETNSGVKRVRTKSEDSNSNAKKSKPKNVKKNSKSNQTKAEGSNSDGKRVRTKSEDSKLSSKIVPTKKENDSKSSKIGTKNSKSKYFQEDSNEKKDSTTVRRSTRSSSNSNISNKGDDDEEDYLNLEDEEAELIELSNSKSPKDLIRSNSNPKVDSPKRSNSNVNNQKKGGSGFESPRRSNRSLNTKTESPMVSNLGFESPRRSNRTLNTKTESPMRSNLGFESPRRSNRTLNTKTESPMRSNLGFESPRRSNRTLNSTPLKNLTEGNAFESSLRRSIRTSSNIRIESPSLSKHVIKKLELDEFEPINQTSSNRTNSNSARNVFKKSEPLNKSCYFPDENALVIDVEDSNSDSNDEFEEVRMASKEKPNLDVSTSSIEEEDVQILKCLNYRSGSVSSTQNSNWSSTQSSNRTVESQNFFETLQQKGQQNSSSKRKQSNTPRRSKGGKGGKRSLDRSQSDIRSFFGK